MRSTSGKMHPFDLRCLVHFPINGGHNEQNHFCDIDNCTNGRNCGRSVHFMPRGIYSRCHGLHNHSRRRMPIGPHINWHSNQLYRVQPRRFVHNVCTGEYNIQRQHRLICIRTGLRNGINHPVAQSAPPLRRGELYPATVRSQFPSIGGVARSAGVVREFKNTHLVPFVIASKAWRSSK